MAKELTARAKNILRDAKLSVDDPEGIARKGRRFFMAYPNCFTATTKNIEEWLSLQGYKWSRDGYGYEPVEKLPKRALDALKMEKLSIDDPQAIAEHGKWRFVHTVPNCHAKTIARIGVWLRQQGYEWKHVDPPWK